MKMNLAFRAFGQPGRPVVVLVHGGGISSWSCEPVARQLERDFYVLTPDLPEHGRTGLAAGPLTISGAAEQIALLIEQCAPDGKALVFGVSLGAQITVELLARHAVRVERAVVSSAMLRSIWVTAWMTPGVARWSYRWFMEPQKNNDGYIRVNMKKGTGIPEEYFALYKQDFQETTAESTIHTLIVSKQYRLPSGLERVNVPVLAIAGRREYGQMKQSARDLAAALPNGRAIQLDLGKDASMAIEHSWPIHRPELCARLIRAFRQDEPLPDEFGVFA